MINNFIPLLYLNLYKYIKFFSLEMIEFSRYLCLQKKVAANQVFETFTTSHPTITKQQGPPFLLPLLNFIWLLLSAIDR